MPKKTRGVFERPKGSGIFWCQYFAHGKRHREKVGSWSNARDLYQSRKTDIRVGTKLPELRRRQTTFGELIDLAIDHAKEHNRSAKDYVIKGELLRTEFGVRAVETITQDDLASWIRARDVSGATFNRYRSFLSLCYREALSRGLVSRNVASLIRQKREAAGRQRFLSRDEYTRMVAAMETVAPQHLDAFIVSVHTGLRLGEQFRLLWQHIDFERREIAVRDSKNGEDAEVPMSSLVLKVLRARYQRAREGGVAHGRSNPVFPEIGSLKFIETLPWFPDALALAKVESYTWHCNRHTFCSWLASGGTPLKTIQDLARHKMISMTARYAHLCPDHKRAEIERMLDFGQKKKMARKSQSAEVGDTTKVVSIASATATATGPQPVVSSRPPKRRKQA